MVTPRRLHLLSVLRANSREKLTSISKKTRIPISTLYDFIRDMHGTVITRNTILLDFNLLGYHTLAHISLKVRADEREEIRNYLRIHPHVNSCFRVQNTFDFVIETVHHTLKDLDYFLQQLRSSFEILDHDIHYLIEDVKREGFEFI